MLNVSRLFGRERICQGQEFKAMVSNNYSICIDHWNENV